jgi:hypothetical protein
MVERTGPIEPQTDQVKTAAASRGIPQTEIVAIENANGKDQGNSTSELVYPSGD